MFVASVVPHPRLLLAELRRVVRPGGHILFVNHFVSEKSGPRRFIEKSMAPFSRALGWHPEFAPQDLFGPHIPANVTFEPLSPGGLFTLVQLPR